MKFRWSTYLKCRKHLNFREYLEYRFSANYITFIGSNYNRFLRKEYLKEGYRYYKPKFKVCEKVERMVMRSLIALFGVKRDVK